MSTSMPWPGYSPDPTPENQNPVSAHGLLTQILAICTARLALTTLSIEERNRYTVIRDDATSCRANQAHESTHVTLVTAGAGFAAAAGSLATAYEQVRMCKQSLGDVNGARPDILTLRAAMSQVTHIDPLGMEHRFRDGPNRGRSNTAM